jgi:hypothetical protein
VKSRAPDDSTSHDVSNEETECHTRVVGLWRGREIDVRANLYVEIGALRFESDATPPVRVRMDGLDGCQLNATNAVLYLNSGDVLDVSLLNEAARLAMRAAVESAFTMPELTRSLRELGAIGGADAAAHDRWFAPLLVARRALVGVSDPLRQLALFDVDKLRDELARALAELAAQRAGGDAPRARALDAILEDETEPVRRAMARVAIAASALEGSDSDSRLGDWRRWVRELMELYRAADNAWPAIARALRSAL